MNTSIIRYILGYVAKIEAALLLIPFICGLIYKEYSVAVIYVIVAAIVAGLGILMTIKKPANTTFYLKEGCVATALSWIILSLFGAIPMYLTGEIPSYLDATFEIVSGFTTTGSSILNEIESLSHASLLWRSFTHWVGGMGVLVFLLAVIPLAGGGSGSGSYMNLMKAESPGPSVGKFGAKLRNTAIMLYVIYFALTLVEFLMLWVGDMDFFAALNTAVSTAGTGGFAIYNDSMTSQSLYTQWIVAIFMVLFGVNFNFYYLIFLVIKGSGKFKIFEEVRWYFGLVLSATVVIAANLMMSGQSLKTASIDSFFAVGTVVSTTGFGTADFDTWNTLCKTILVLLMFMGGCAGSTGGGIKVTRILIILKGLKREIKAYLHPHIVQYIKVDKEPLGVETLRSIHGFIYTYITIFVVSMLLVAIEGQDVVTTFTSIVASMSNIGPGLAKIGPTCNYAFFTPFSKVVLMFDMLAGRLELFPMLMLLTPRLYKDIAKQIVKR